MVSIICCTMRNSYMKNIFQNYERQDYRKKEMIIVLNKDDMDIEAWRTEAKKYKNVSVYQVSEQFQLGKCLNYGIKKAKFDILAKFDDDDYYATHYLKEAMDLLSSNPKISVVGKHTSFVYFQEQKALMIYREGAEHKYRKHVKGGTLVFRRSVWDRIKFNEKRANGSDAVFLRRCKRDGYRVYSVSRYNYVCIRRADLGTHTQKTSAEKYMTRCTLVSQTKDFIPLITKFL
ncbi:glycosyltransferase [Paenibacillus spongiae]|uniref:Glycosyltransferase family 2 protein n=1 Tax=Paenibacillus spongiae TaxID=2909671 RepID=A0ABY5S4V7_9BACL|nr:glycosyltransferase family A protein [Paenibacillus spongiae]UVI28625.1 glycosyltransferase family 2 protein [Paenibacillus spongiae]